MEALILTIIATSIPLLLAATGELIGEKSGILNLGVEGMMLSGAVGALGAVLWLENPYYGIVAGALSGVLMASIFCSKSNSRLNHQSYLLGEKLCTLFFLILKIFLIR